MTQITEREWILIRALPKNLIITGLDSEPTGLRVKCYTMSKISKLPGTWTYLVDLVVQFLVPNSDAKKCLLSYKKAPERFAKEIKGLEEQFTESAYLRILKSMQGQT